MARLEKVESNIGTSILARGEAQNGGVRNTHGLAAIVVVKTSDGAFERDSECDCLVTPSRRDEHSRALDSGESPDEQNDSRYAQILEFMPKISSFDSSDSLQVYGALLGRQKGRNVELCTSFEIKMKPSEDKTGVADEDIDLEFLNTQIAQCKVYW